MAQAGGRNNVKQISPFCQRFSKCEIDRALANRGTPACVDDRDAQGDGKAQTLIDVGAPGADGVIVAAGDSGCTCVCALKGNTIQQPKSLTG